MAVLGIERPCDRSSIRQLDDAALRAACEDQNGLSREGRDALVTLKERVARDALPLLRLLQILPLQLQSSHLSFQEFYAARAISDGSGLLVAGDPPWRWSVWWANALSLGEQIGLSFGQMLPAAAGVLGSSLDLSRQLGGHGPTARKAVGQLMLGLTSLRLDHNRIGEREREDPAQDTFRYTHAEEIASGLVQNGRLTALSLADNSLRTGGTVAIAHALCGQNATLRSLNLDGNAIGGVEISDFDVGALAAAAAAAALGDIIRSVTTLQSLSVARNELGVTGAHVIAEALSGVDTAGPRPSKGSLEALNMLENGIGTRGAVALVAAAWGFHPKKTAAFLNAGQSFESIVRAASAKGRAPPRLTSLCGLGTKEVTADFSRRSLASGDAMLLAFDLHLGSSLESLNLDFNRLAERRLADSFAVSQTHLMEAYGIAFGSTRKPKATHSGRLSNLARTAVVSTSCFGLMDLESQISSSESYEPEEYEIEA